MLLTARFFMLHAATKTCEKASSPVRSKRGECERVGSRNGEAMRRTGLATGEWSSLFMLAPSGGVVCTEVKKPVD